MPTLKIELTESALKELKRAAAARLVRPENIAQAVIEDHVRQCIVLERKFRDAAHAVDARLNHAA